MDGDVQAQALQVLDLRSGGSDLPMPVLKHQMSHVRRRPYSKAAPAREHAEHKQDSESPGADAQ